MRCAQHLDRPFHSELVARRIPRLDQSNLGLLAVHIVIVTAVAIALVVVGVDFRTGVLF